MKFGLPVQLVLVLGAAAPITTQEPVEVVPVELVGPLSTVSLAAGGSETRLYCELGPGDRRSLDAPLVASPGAGEAIGPTFSDLAAPATARLEIGGRRSPGEWKRLPFSLQSRSLPPIERRRPRPGPARWALVACGALLVFGLRRRPGQALFVGGAMAAGIFLLPVRVSRAATVRVLEGDGESGIWLDVRGARDRLDLPRAEPGWTRCLPPRRGLPPRSAGRGRRGPLGRGRTRGAALLSR